MAESRFNIVEARIEDIHRGFSTGELTCRQLVQVYLDRIAAYDKQGPALNCIVRLCENSV
jgi:amidase